MRKRFFFPIFILFVFFPLIVFLASFTRFFNREVRDALVMVVDDGTNANLHLGEIHGSVFGTFVIDGAALLYHGQPVAMVDTVRISHLPLSLITKTIQVTDLELVNPRFFLIRYKDGTYNVDRIGKPSGTPGGKFDWTILVRSVILRGGEFTLYDSTADKQVNGRNSRSHQRFDATNFKVQNLSLAASASLAGDNLSVNMRNLSLLLERPRVNVDSLSFGLFTSPGGTELSGLRLRSGRTVIHADLTLTGQDILDSLNIHTVRGKYFTASVHASDADLEQVKDFVSLPLDTLSKFGLTLFASGTLDSLNVKQCLLTTDSCTVPLYASFTHVIDSTITMDVRASDARVNMRELSSALRGVGFPNAGRLGTLNLFASAQGPPHELRVSAELSNEATKISAQSLIHRDGYEGEFAFKGLNVAEIVNAGGFNTFLNGSGSFVLHMNGESIPDGTATLTIDSSAFDQTVVPQAFVQVLSSHDSLDASVNLLTSRGNVAGSASLNAATSVYSGDFSFSELNLAPFTHVNTLKSDLTGRLLVDGRGFNVDSMQSELSLLTEQSSLGKFNLGNSAFAVELNTTNTEKDLQVHSPFFAVSVHGKFLPHKLPGDLASLFAGIADSFSNRFTGGSDTLSGKSSAVPGLDANVDVDVKDARLFGQLTGDTSLFGDASTHFVVRSDKDSVSISGYCSSDTLAYQKDSVSVLGSNINLGFDFRSGPGLSVWKSGAWSADGKIGAVEIGKTRLYARALHVEYSPGDSARPPLLNLAVNGGVDTLVGFDVHASANVDNGGFSFVADTVTGSIYGVPLAAESHVFVKYSPETFVFSPALFNAELNSVPGTPHALVTAQGAYSLESGADLHFGFENVGLRSVQKIMRLDTTNLKLNGRVSGWADLKNEGSRMLLSLGYRGNNIEYNRTRAKWIDGKLTMNGDVMAIDAQLSKEEDSASYALKLNGTVPLSGNSAEGLHLDLTADSLNISFLTPFIAGVEDFGGTLSGNMNVSGKYSTPEMKGTMELTDGRIRLLANEVNYLLKGTIKGDGDKLVLAPMMISDVPGQPGGTILANGSITIGENTIKKFDLLFDGSLLVLNSSAQRTLQGIYGSAVVGAGKSGLRLGGSLDRPMLSGTLNIQAADMTLLPLQRKEDLAAQEIIYHFPQDTSAKASVKQDAGSGDAPVTASSGSLIDSLRYDVEVETKDNVNLRMIFDPTTNEELSAVLGGRLHLSNLSGSMELTGDVSVQNNSYYNFYGRHFAASGKLSFTGNPLNPTLNIDAQYQGEHIASGDTTNQKTESVVVELGITGTFDRPNAPDMSLTVDGIPYQGDAQTNAISFILTNEFADQLTNPQRRSVADNLWSQAGVGILSAGTSVLSGALTNLFSREFSFIRSAELRYSSIADLANPDVAITTQFGKATIRVGGQVFSSIGNADVSVDYPLTELLGNMLYLQLSRKTALNNQTYLQRETVNALRLFYQLSF